mgnify:CR=1 FL=1
MGEARSGRGRERLARYREAADPLPKSYLSWDLYGAGIENLGRGGRPVEIPLRPPQPDEILLRVDAVGLCFSDTKLIWAGAEHPRIRGRDLQKDPTVPGHEAALTVMAVGANWRSRFARGQRFIIQADIFIGGEQKAFGYVQRGAMAQYVYAGPWVLAGDAGCYLLPLQEKTGYAEAALVEPWACVEAAYHIASRQRPMPGGRLLIVFAGKRQADFSGLYADGEAPAFTAVLGESEMDLTPVLGDCGVVKRFQPSPAAIEALRQEGNGEGFDDIIIAGQVAPEIVRACDAALSKKGMLIFAGSCEWPAAALDIGRIHYHDTRHAGTATLCVREAYIANGRSEIRPRGAAWMIGAAGPMGQMHVQRALELETPPAQILATDISAERLAYMRQRLQPLAERKGVSLECLDVSRLPDLDSHLQRIAPRGWDDIVVLAPSAKLVEDAARFLGESAVLNIFAGVAPGTMANMPISIFPRLRCRVIGSSGSSLDDIKGVLKKLEAGQLATRMSVAAIGGIDAVAEGLQAVKAGGFPGKIVIFPHLRLPLTGLDKVSAICPEAAASLERGDIWTNETEAALLAQLLATD